MGVKELKTGGVDLKDVSVWITHSDNAQRIAKLLLSWSKEVKEVNNFSIGVPISAEKYSLKRTVKISFRKEVDKSFSTLLENAALLGYIDGDDLRSISSFKELEQKVARFKDRIVSFDVALFKRGERENPIIESVKVPIEKSLFASLISNLMVQAKRRGIEGEDWDFKILGCDAPFGEAAKRARFLKMDGQDIELPVVIEHSNFLSANSLEVKVYLEPFWKEVERKVERAASKEEKSAVLKGAAKAFLSYADSLPIRPKLEVPLDEVRTPIGIMNALKKDGKENNEAKEALIGLLKERLAEPKEILSIFPPERLRESLAELKHLADTAQVEEAEKVILDVVGELEREASIGRVKNEKKQDKGCGIEL